MQNTQQQTTSAEYVTNMVWNLMDRTRGRMSITDMFPLILAFLYSCHKGYTIRVINDSPLEFPQNDDILLQDLVSYIPSGMRANVYVREFYENLALIGQDEFNSVYADILKDIYDLISSIPGCHGVFRTPSEITRLIAYFVKKEGCSSVFDPFCGTASIVFELTDAPIPVHFEGQELMATTSLYARLTLEAVHDYDCNVTTCDSFKYWNNKHFDAVVSCPPLGLRLSERQMQGTEQINPEYPCRSVEDIMQIRSFYRNHANITVTLLTRGFFFRGNRDYDLRRYLVDNNLVDTIIALPANILYGTAIPTVVLVCKRNRHAGEHVRFIHAEDYFQENHRRRRTFDYARFVEMIEGNGCDCVDVSLDEIVKYNYNLNPSLYYKMDFDLKEGQQVKRISELLEPVEGERISSRDISEMVSIRNLSNDFIEVLLNDGKQSSPSEIRRNSNCRVFNSSEAKYLLTANLGGVNLYGINTCCTGINCTADIKVYKVNESLVSPKYLAYTLITNDAINKGRTPLSDCMMHPIVIDNLSVQKEIVNKLVQQYDQKVTAEREADAMRLGVKQNISDLEHMLGSTQLRINKIIARLEGATPASENYPHIVKSMKDNIEYMNRVIHYNNARIDSESFNLKEGDIVGFIKGYIDAWNNYGGGYFEIDFVNDLFDTPRMSFDKTLLTVMLDSILNNAILHGFHKRKNHTDHNMVQLRLSVVEYKEAPYILLSIANNGDPIADGFTIEDYISRGRYTATTGRSGLGGYHVHQIAKGHKGVLCLDSNIMWNMIVEVLLPIDSTDYNDIPVFDNECI